MRSSSGAAASGGVAGGDFRFQGQWLEQGTGIYNFRARDYDAKTGMFLSRDPVEPLQYEPESFNPYQFVYHNPHVYSDPTGMITLTELNAGLNGQTILQNFQRAAVSQAKDYIKDRLGNIFGDVMGSFLQSFLPGSSFLDVIQSTNPRNAGREFEYFAKGELCDAIRGTSLENMWIAPGVNVGGTPVGVDLERVDPYLGLLPIEQAANQGNLEIFNIFLKANAQHRNALIYATKAKQIAIVQALIDVGTNLDVRDVTAEFAGWTPLMHASFLGYIERLKKRQRPNVPQRDATLTSGNADTSIPGYLDKQVSRKLDELKTKQSTLRLEAEISDRLMEACQVNGISREVLIEALFQHYEADEQAWSAILAEAKRRAEVRVQIANMKRAKSMMQRFGDT